MPRHERHRTRGPRPLRREIVLLRHFFRANAPGVVARRALDAIRRVPLRTILVAVTLVLIASVTVSALVALKLVSDTPDWWKRADFNNKRTDDLARRVEVAVVERVHQPRPESEVWRVSVDVRQANAWLNAKLPAWVESRELEWPDRVTQIQADFNDGIITLGAKLDKDAASQIVAASFQLEVRDDGALWIKQPRARAGRLDLPSGWTVARLREWLPPELEQSEVMDRALVALAGDGPLFEQARIKLGDGRIVRLLHIASQSDHLLIQAVTLRRDISGDNLEPRDDHPAEPPDLNPQPMAHDGDTTDAPGAKAGAPRR